MEQKKEAFEAIARTLALSANQIVAGTDKHLLSDLSSRVRNSRMDLEYVVISDKNGGTVFAESKDLPKKPYRAGMRWWMVVRRIVGYGGVNPDNIYSVSVPARINGDRTGTLTAGFSLSGMEEMVNVVQEKAILGVALGLIVGVLCAIAMAKSLTGPLQSLVIGARAVSAGNYDVKAPSGGGKEIQELAQAFSCMVETLSSSRDQLTQRANTDSLTGLYNHRYFQQRIAEEINRAERYNHNLSLLMIDIDFFKMFNDSYGHPAGDSVLRNLAQTLLKNVRDTDTAVRYGGEEFAVILPETDLDEASLLAERVRMAVHNGSLADALDEQVSITISVGLATYPLHCADRVGLISAADVALYQAKSLGRNRLSCYDVSMPGIPEADPYKFSLLLQAQDMPTIEALSDAIDAKLKLPAGHSRSVAHLASAAAKKLGQSEQDCTGIYIASLLRDVGEIGVPDAILSKPGSLTDQEIEVVRTHSALGHSIVQKAPKLSPMLSAILHHHERFDGRGYPSGLSGEGIPIQARILAVADAYQSMITLRPHRGQMSQDEAREELLRQSSVQFDPCVVQVLLEVLSEDQSMPKAA
jgi:diguanylate cyclase (GGDEF)-like protein